MHEIKLFFESLGLWTVMLLTLIKVGTSIIVAVQESRFKPSELGNAFKDDVIKLAAVVLLAIFADGQNIGGFAPVDVIVAGFAAWESARIAANLAVIFPFFGSIVPQGIQKTGQPPITTVEVVNASTSTETGNPVVDIQTQPKSTE